MADGLVQAVVQGLGQILASEVNLRAGLSENIVAIQDGLKQISAFLKNADMRAEEDARMKELVNSVRVLAYAIEDVVEAYQLSHKDILGFNSHSMSKESLSICKRLKSIHSDIKRSENNSVRQGSTDTQVTRASPVIQESELIAFQAPKNELIELLGLREMDLKRETIAVLGMRGVGKTTIVGSVYNDPLVKEFFPFSAWIAASPTSKLTDILKIMMKQFYDGEREIAELQQASSSSSSRSNVFDSKAIKNISSQEGAALDELVRKYLQHKRYMVVFDDVQEENKEWDKHLKRVLPANKGSKIIMITRYKNMASAWLDGSAHGLYKLVPQAQEDAWKLFCKMTFPNDNGRCPTWLNNIAHRLVGRCEGLPLAIMGIARVLSMKKNELREWEKVQDNIGLYLQQNQYLTGIYKILNRDYHELEHYLKPCILYFGLFPKRYSVNPTRLIRLWIAEGFVREKGTLTLEEIAEEYLNNLINMCLVLVVCTDSTGKPKRLRVHDFVHEIILFKLEELNFCQILPRALSSCNKNPRRFSIHKEDGTNDALEVLMSNNEIDISKIRSLYLFDQQPQTFFRVLTKGFFNKVKLLKVLDLCDAPIVVLSDAIGILLNLRYLSLRNTGVQNLPSSIGKLQRLQTLDLKHTNIHELPREVSKLCNLRHLLAYFYRQDPNFSYHTKKVEGIKMPEGALENFKELQKLAFVDVGCTKELVHLKQLRKLGITKLGEPSNAKDICDAIEGMRYLQFFSVFTTYTNYTISILECMTSPPPTLKCLYLSGCLRSLPESILQLESLVKVRLEWSNLERNPLEILQKLPNLLELHLLEAYAGINMHIGDVGFPKLKVLRLLDLRNLKSFDITSPAFPLLEDMSIGESPNLSMPTGIKYLPKLKILNFYGMPESFLKDTQPGGRHCTIISHVRNVFSHIKCGNGNWKTDKM